MNKKLQILNAHEADVKLNRIAYQIVEDNIESRSLVLAGIEGSGEVPAELLKGKIEAISKIKVERISINVNKQNPVECTITKGFDPSNQNIIIVDDVTNSGRTLMYALKPLLNASPSKVQVAVLVDRKHKQYPVTPDFVGLQLSTTLQDHIRVEIKNNKIAGAFVE